MDRYRPVEWVQKGNRTIEFLIEDTMEEIFKNSKRIHDDFYLNENLKVKESFKFLLNEIKNNFKAKSIFEKLFFK